ncbi:hypothetical protein GEMRC1_002482 [Eukaryota sp. GEM-RC1]
MGKCCYHNGAVFDPVLLPCGHIVCHPCLQLMKTNNCPGCGQEVPSDNDSVIDTTLCRSSLQELCLVFEDEPSTHYSLETFIDETPHPYTDVILLVALQICKTVQKIHDKGIPHGQINLQNILVQIHEFEEVSVLISTKPQSSSAVVLPDDDSAFSQDISDLGYVLYCLYTLNTNPSSVSLSRIPSLFSPIFQYMLSSDPAERPTISEVVTILEGMVNPKSGHLVSVRKNNTLLRKAIKATRGRLEAEQQNSDRIKSELTFMKEKQSSFLTYIAELETELSSAQKALGDLRMSSEEVFVINDKLEKENQHMQQMVTDLTQLFNELTEWPSEKISIPIFDLFEQQQELLFSTRNSLLQFNTSKTPIQFYYQYTKDQTTHVAEFSVSPSSHKLVNATLEFDGNRVVLKPYENPHCLISCIWFLKAFLTDEKMDAIHWKFFQGQVVHEVSHLASTLNLPSFAYWFFSQMLAFGTRHKEFTFIVDALLNYFSTSLSSRHYFELLLMLQLKRKSFLN